MATRREKALAAAEKLVKRGRLESAIDQLRKVLKETPDDTRTLNRVGDLYARLNRVDEAVELFSQAAERFSSEGFFVKAIAIFKKILRLDPTRMSIYESLAELYQQQGLANEARAQYEVLADYYEKASDPAAVLAVHEKLVELNPADFDSRVQLADLLAQAERPEEALEQFGAVAKGMLESGAQDEALVVLDHAVQTVPDNLQFVMQTVALLQAVGAPELAGRFVTAAEEHNPQAKEARGLLEQVPKTEVEPEEEAAEVASAEPVEEEPTPPADEELATLTEEAPAPLVEKEPADEEAPTPMAETAEFEIELEAFEEALSTDEPSAPAEVEPPEAAEELIEVELAEIESIEQEVAAEPEPAADEVGVEEDVAEILAEADALASYGLDEKAIDRLERAIELDSGHLGAYRRLIGIQLNARRDEQVVRLAAEAASAALESGNAVVWRQIVGDLKGRGFSIEGSRVVPPPAAQETPAELLVDEPPAELEPEAATPVAAPVEAGKETAVGTAEPSEAEKEEAELLEALGPEEEEAPAEAVLAGADADFFDLGAELEQELGGDQEMLEEGPAMQSQSIEEIVEGFKQGMAEVLSPEAYDTHYNLGIAYREMGLVDEAIGEFQLAAKDPRYLVECCSLLGSCFQEKDFSDLALKWYAKGLESPSVTDEETLGLLYEMGNIHLSEGDRDAARAAFTEIYGNNSNFRDVAAKLEELRD